MEIFEIFRREKLSFLIGFEFLILKDFVDAFCFISFIFRCVFNFYNNFYWVWGVGVWGIFGGFFFCFLVSCFGVLVLFIIF